MAGKWVKGQSGNPRGKDKDPIKQEVLAIFKEAAPGLLLMAIERARAGDNNLLKELVKKAIPDSIKVEGEITLMHKLAGLKAIADE